MPYLNVGEENGAGIDLYYKDWGEGRPVVFSHGWPLSADAFEDQMFFLASRGYRCIAHDRRGHGRSSQPGHGNDMDTYADDLAALVDALDLEDAIHVGHSTGGGEVTRYMGRHGTKRVSKAVLIAAVPPGLVKSQANPDGLPIEEFDGIRTSIAKDRAQFYREFAVPFYGANRSGSEVSKGLIEQFVLVSMQGGLKSSYECVKAFSETDFLDDLKKFDVPTLLMHGEDDQIVPIDISSRRTARLVEDVVEIYYPGLPHGMCSTHKDQINADLLAFLEGTK